MAKTVVKKIDSPHPDVSIFKINGVLGYHENSFLEKFFGECSNGGIKKLIMDFSELSSLGGGCAKVIRGAANEGQVVVCIIGASAMVHSFLEKSGKTKIIYAYAGFHRGMSASYFIHSSTMKAYGVEFGLDKLGHTFAQGQGYV